MKEGILELVPEKLYRLGGIVEADPRISWLPPGREGYEPINAYLLLEGYRAVLIDTGVTLHGDLIVEQLRELLPPDPVLSVFLTRIEMDCISNLHRVAEAFPIESVHAGGASNPFDFFDDLESSAIATRSARLERIAGDGTLALSDTRMMRVLKTKLRLLSTTWAFDEATGTLFTSDSFGYVGLAEAGRRADLVQRLRGRAPRPCTSTSSRSSTSCRGRHARHPGGRRGALRAPRRPRHRPVPRLRAVGRELVRDHLGIVDEALSMCGKGAR